jgi:SAM-dependent methyltransferase
MMTWYDDDRFWHEAAPLLFRPARWEAAKEEIELLLELLELHEEAAVLDMACGPGRHTLELARRGFHVTGVDRTEKYLDEARRMAEEEGLNIEWVQADMREFKRPETFDAAINLFTSFGYFEEIEDDRRVLSNLLASLKPGGRLVMDMMGKEIMARIFQPRDWERMEDGSIALYERRIERDWSWVENTWIILREGNPQEFKLGHRIYSASELATLLRGVGFERVQAYGWLDGSPYDHQARRLVMKGQRRKE